MWASPAKRLMLSGTLALTMLGGLGAVASAAQANFLPPPPRPDISVFRSPTRAIPTLSATSTGACSVYESGSAGPLGDRRESAADAVANVRRTRGGDHLDRL